MRWNTATDRSESIHLIKMTHLVFFFILTVDLVNIVCTVRIGHIYNATCISNITRTIIRYKNTCDECLCNAFFSAEPPLYVGLNCYANNKTCHLFANYSSPSVMAIDSNSTFIFVRIPPLQNVTTGNSTSLSVLQLIIDSNSMLRTVSLVPVWLKCEWVEVLQYLDRRSHAKNINRITVLLRILHTWWDFPINSSSVRPVSVLFTMYLRRKSLEICMSFRLRLSFIHRRTTDLRLLTSSCGYMWIWVRLKYNRVQTEICGWDVIHTPPHICWKTISVCNSCTQHNIYDTNSVSQ